MKVKVFLTVLFVLLFLSANSFSQRPTISPMTPPVLQNNDEDTGAAEFYKIGDITGNIGGAKAILLPKPVYSSEAKEAGAEGKVKVEIVIDESGSVISAKAVSGNQMLYEAAQNAALQSRFSVPKIDGQGTKVSGFLNYNFLIESPNWFKVGYDLALIEKVPSLGFFQIPIIRKVIKPDWETEYIWLDELQKIRAEEKKALAQMSDNTPVLRNERTANGNNQTVQMRLNIPPQNPQKFELAQNLISSLPLRLANDESNLWKFNLGIAFVKMQEIFRNPNTRQGAIEILKPFLKNVPGNMPVEYTENLKSLIELFENKSASDLRNEIFKTIAKLQRIK